MTPQTPFDMDTAIQSLQSSFQKIFGVPLLHVKTAAVEPHFPDGRNDWVLCNAFIGPSGPILLYLGTQTMEREAQGGAAETGVPNWDDYAWTVMRTFASQTQAAYLAVDINKPYLELTPVAA